MRQQQRDLREYAQATIYVRKVVDNQKVGRSTLLDAILCAGACGVGTAPQSGPVSRLWMEGAIPEVPLGVHSLRRQKASELGRPSAG